MEQAASPAMLVDWKQSAADLRPNGGSDESSDVQHAGTPKPSLQWTMMVCLRLSPAQ